MRIILGEKMAVNLKANKEAFTSVISFSLKKLKRCDLTGKYQFGAAIQAEMDFTRCVSCP